MTISTPLSRNLRTANFYFNDRAIGSGREAFAAIVTRLRMLPAGTSIVWGPNYNRSGSGPGGPGCVPKFLYPDLWSELESVVKERRCVLSSAYPGPFTMNVGRHFPADLSAALLTNSPKPDERFDAVLDWEVGEKLDNKELEPELSVVQERRWHRFSSADKPLLGFDLQLFFRRLPENKRVLVRLTVNKGVEEASIANSPAELAENIRAVWRKEVHEDLKNRKLSVALSGPPAILDVLRNEAKESELPRINWWRYYGPGTEHAGVLYGVNGQYIGRGDEGFDRVLAAIGKLPVGSGVIMPEFTYFGLEETTKKKKGIDVVEYPNAVPFEKRRAAFDATIAERKLSVVHCSLHDSGDWVSFHSFGRVVRYDERPLRAATRLSWYKYRGGKLNEDGTKIRDSVDDAVYTVDDVEQGKGLGGFSKAMDKLAALPAGSVAQVRICIRTRAPFLCPEIYEDQHHFENTGYAPYEHMFPWLAEVARKGRLKIEWIPDEEKGCEDCGLNRFDSSSAELKGQAISLP